MHHLTPLALEYWQSSPRATRSAETLAALCAQLATTYAQPHGAEDLHADALTEAQRRGWLPRETLARAAHGLSSGTMATLTGHTHCVTLGDIQNRFALWCAGHNDEHATWQDAWSAYWPRDPAHPATTAVSLKTLAQTITQASARTQAQLDKEEIEIEIKTRLRPRKAQAEPVGLFAQEQLNIFGQ